LLLFNFVKEVACLLCYLLGQGLIVFGFVIFVVQVPVVIGAATTTAATATMKFLEKLEVVLVERPRDHPVLFPVIFVLDLYLAVAGSIRNYAVSGVLIAMSNEGKIILGG
jgi:uncharacterized membrane protein